MAIVTGRRSATFCELIADINQIPTDVVHGHLQRHDFSRWIGHTFADTTWRVRCELWNRNFVRLTT